MKMQTFSDGRTHRPTTSLFATLGFTTLSAIIIVTFAVCDPTEKRDEAATPLSAESSTVTRRGRGLWYIRLGQWRADARTVIATVRYVLENDSPTNQVRPFGHFPGLEVAMPTNSASASPRA